MLMETKQFFCVHWPCVLAKFYTADIAAVYACAHMCHETKCWVCRNLSTGYGIKYNIMSVASPDVQVCRTNNLEHGCGSYRVPRILSYVMYC